MYGYNAEPPIAIPIYTVLPYCVIPLHTVMSQCRSCIVSYCVVCMHAYQITYLGNIFQVIIILYILFNGNTSLVLRERAGLLQLLWYGM